MPNDAKIHDIAVNYIHKKMMGQGSKWPSITIGALHSSLVNRLSLENGELVILSAFLSNESWYVFTTRRILCRLQGVDYLLESPENTPVGLRQFQRLRAGRT